MPVSFVKCVSVYELKSNIGKLTIKECKAKTPFQRSGFIAWNNMNSIVFWSLLYAVSTLQADKRKAFELMKSHAL